MREENDPDTLQLLDELNVNWVNQWRKKTKEALSSNKDLTFTVIIPEKELPRENRSLINL